MPWPFQKRREYSIERRPVKKPVTQKDVLNSAWIKFLRRNPKMAERMAAKEFKALDLMDSSDPVEDLKKLKLAEALENDPDFANQVKEEYLAKSKSRDVTAAVQEAIDMALLERVRKDPAILARAVDKRLDNLVGGAPKTEFGQFLDQMRELDDFRDSFRGEPEEKKDDWFKEIAMEAVKAFAPSLPGLLLGKKAALGRIYVIETPEGVKEVDSTGYLKYLEEKGKLQLPEGVTPVNKVVSVPPKPLSDTPRSSQDESKPEDSNNTPPINRPLPVTHSEKEVSLNLKEWLPWVDKEPLEFVEFLDKTNNEWSTMVLNIFYTFTVEELFKRILPFKKSPEYTELITTIENHKDWLEQVIDIVKITHNG